MDTSKEYIKMCEKAKEIQEKWKSKRNKDGDFVAHHNKKIIILSNPVLRSGWDCYTFLPRQDQLQEMMLPKDCGALWIMFGAFWCKEKTEGKSFEQLWLAFVMKEKYNKIWDGKEWRS